MSVALTTMANGVILDVDGTLVASNDAHARAWVEALAEQGIHVAFERVRPLIGMGGDKLLPIVAGFGVDTPRGTTVSRRRGEIFRERYLRHVRPTRGATALLETLRDRGLRLVVASSAQEEDLRPLLAIVHADWLLPRTTSSDEAERSKPDPDVVHAALGEIALPPERVCMLGDTPYDVEAATRTGIATIAVRCGGWTDDALKGARAIYDDPEDLRVHLDASPLGERRPSGST